MDRVLSTRVDDVVYRKIGDLAHKMHLSKKAVLEKAINLLSQECQGNYSELVVRETCGAWKRKEKAAKTVEKNRKAFNASQERYKR